MTLLDYYEYLVYNRECLDMLFLLENVYEVESGSMNDINIKPGMGTGRVCPRSLT